VIGERSNAGLFDEERGGDYRSEAIGQGLASAILLGSFGGQGGRSGFSSKDLKLACAKHGLNWNYADGALLELENRCFYLHTATAGSLGKRYWFGIKPTLNKLVVQYRQQSAKENFAEEILEDLRAEWQKGAPAGATWRVIVNPAEDLPEQKSLTLLVLPPSLAWDENGGAKDLPAPQSGAARQAGARGRSVRALGCAPDLPGTPWLRVDHAGRGRGVDSSACRLGDAGEHRPDPEGRWTAPEGCRRGFPPIHGQAHGRGQGGGDCGTRPSLR
jgi:hypothetical protein